jgi:hypothetical protein
VEWRSTDQGNLTAEYDGLQYTIIEYTDARGYPMCTLEIHKDSTYQWSRDYKDIRTCKGQVTRLINRINRYTQQEDTGMVQTEKYAQTDLIYRHADGNMIWLCSQCVKEMPDIELSERSAGIYACDGCIGKDPGAQAPNDWQADLWRTR